MPKPPDKETLLAELRPRRGKWGPRPAEVTPEPAGPGEESVWSYPRPPEIRPAPARAEVVFGGRIIALSSRALRVVETAGAPVYYFPPEDVAREHLSETSVISFCEWKGAAVHYDLVVDGNRAAAAAFAYPDPLDDLGRGFARIAGWIGFHPGRVDAARVGGETARAQPGGVYAGCITDAVKGAPGTEDW